MSGLRTWLQNPNVHLFFSAILQVLAFIPATAAYAPIIQTVATTLTATGLVLPESGSLHQADYAKIADAVAASLRPQVETTAGRA